MKLVNYKNNYNESGLYLIKNLINGKVYVGSTQTSFVVRKRKHLSLFRRNLHYNEYLQNDWNYYGENNFSFEILKIVPPQECLKAEGLTIKLYSSHQRKYGYNIASTSSFKIKYKISANHNEEKSCRKRDKAKTINGLTSKERGLSKPFKIYNLNGNLIKEYSGASEYLKNNPGSKSHISNVLSKRKLFYKNQIILFSDQVLTKNDIQDANKKTSKRVYLFTLEGNFIDHFSSANECATFLGCKPAEIRMCCLNRRNRIKNYTTSYEKNN